MQIDPAHPSLMATLTSSNRLKISPLQFAKIKKLIYGLCGINLNENKLQLVQARLTKRLTALGLNDLESYFQYLETDQSKKEVVNFIDVLTTNKTNFFRETAHFDFLKNRVIKETGGRNIRIWSAACSSGEEPYTISMVLNEGINLIRKKDVRILATDISTEILERAQQGIYKGPQMDGLDEQRKTRWFTKLSDGSFKVNDSLKSLVSFGRLNLMKPFPMKGEFDVIFCRNVMIYFDKQTQNELVQKMSALLRPGGYLFVGHAESLTGGNQYLKYVQPAVYQK